MIDQPTVQRIIEAAEIVDVVSDFVSLKKRGVNYLGNCPFHNEKTPSFTVSPAKGIYKCFGCGKAGNAVGFVMEHEHLTFPDALKWLAKKYHIEVKEKERTPEEIQQQNEHESLMIVTAFAQRFFTEMLYHNSEGMAVGMGYFRERGFRDDIIKKFQLGYSIEKRDAFTREALDKGYKLDYLQKTGLTIVGENYQSDRFHGRVMFPVHNLAGRVIAFGGRILKLSEKTGKYVNSPESEIYHKSDVLYGIYFAKNAIVQKDKCYMVEGYADLIMMHQCGIENVVASSGTSLTVNQIRLVKRFTNNLTILYDGDPAGIKASLRGIDLVLEEGMNVKIILLPEGDDPDSFARKNTTEELNEYIRVNEKDFISFKTQLLLDDAANDPVKRANLIQDIVRSISLIPEPIMRFEYIKECSKIMRTSEDILNNEVNKLLVHKKTKDEQSADAVLNTLEKRITTPLPSFIGQTYSEVKEKEIIRILMKFGNHDIIQHIDVEHEVEKQTVAQYIIGEMQNDELEFKNLVYKQVFEIYRDHLYINQFIDEKYFVNNEDKVLSELASNLLSSPYELSKRWERTGTYLVTEENSLELHITKTILKFKLDIVEMSVKEKQEELKIQSAIAPYPEETITETVQRIMQLNEIKMKLAMECGIIILK